VLELAILGLLKEQPIHGYELRKRLGDTFGFLSGVSYGSLYPALRRLERAGAIEIVALGASDSRHVAPPVATMKP
jgi:DNA-binding PadR family transcriptional regulator